MLLGEHSAILSSFIKLPFVIKIFVLSVFEWPFYTGFTVIQEEWRSQRPVISFLFFHLVHNAYLSEICSRFEMQQIAASHIGLYCL